MPSLSALAAATLLASSLSPAAESGVAAPCLSPTSSYQGWTIHKIEITSPFDFFPAVKTVLQSVETQLPLQQKDGFDATKYHAGVEFISKKIRTQLPLQFTTLRLVVVLDRLENCTAQALDVHYSVYTAFIPALSGSSFEREKAEAEKPSTAAGETGTAGRLALIPDFAYDRARHGYGGMQIHSPAPMGVFEDLKIDATASSNSLVGDMALSGKRTLAAKYLGQASWQLDSSYQDIPAGAQRLKEAKLAAGFFGSTKDLTRNGLTLNYAVSLAGGHQQSTLSPAPASSYGDLKFLANVQGRGSDSAFSASYGLQLGSTLGRHTLDFTKHIVNLRYNLVFSPMPKYQEEKCRVGDPCDDRSKFIGVSHKPLSLETRAAGGIIQQYGVVPSVERFYGGNQANTPFIQGEPWDVSSQAYIRSIPEYQIGSTGAGAFGLGGSRFYSLNLTIAKAVVGKAILPAELGKADFVAKLDGALNTAEGELSDGYFSKEPAVQNVDSEVKTLSAEVDELKLPDPASLDSAAGKRIAPLVRSATLHVKLIDSTVNSITEQQKRNNVNALINGLVPALDTDLGGLINILTAAHVSVDSLTKSKGDIDDALTALKCAWQPNASAGHTDPISAARDRADTHAKADLKPIRKVLNTVLYRLNGYTVAPVGMFDVARVWPAAVGARYGVGGGMRLSILNASFTLGYAANPKRRTGEGPGALFFQIDITDIFH